MYTHDINEQDANINTRGNLFFEEEKNTILTHDDMNKETYSTQLYTVNYWTAVNQSWVIFFFIVQISREDLQIYNYQWG